MNQLPSPSKEKFTLVTGASGLLGKELVHQLLNRGFSVKALYHQHPINDISHPLLETAHCDLLDIDELEEVIAGAEYVYHCAGLISYVPSQRAQLYKINTEATANVVNASLYAGVRKLVHVSSIAALGKMESGKTITEKEEWKDHSEKMIYGHSKYLGEMEVWRGTEEGLDAVIVNPGIILGPGDWSKGSTAIFKNIYHGFKWYSEGVNSFVDVRDVASSMIALMQSDISAERYILSAGNFTYKEVFDLIADTFQKPRPNKKITPLLAALVWRLEKIRNIFSSSEPLITKETAHAAQMKMHYDNSKLLKHLPNFQYHSLKETIAHTCEVLQQSINKH